MADIYLNNGELVATMFSDIAIVDGDDEILQMAIHNIQTIYGENQFHTDIGNKVHERRLKVMDSDADTIIKDCTNAILQDDRVSAVTEMSIYVDNHDKHNLEVQFILLTTSGSSISSMVQIRI